jgi:hypothetical protein
LAGAAQMVAGAFMGASEKSTENPKTFSVMQASTDLTVNGRRELSHHVRVALALARRRYAC